MDEREQILEQLRKMEVGSSWEFVCQNKRLIKDKYANDMEMLVEVLNKIGGSSGTAIYRIDTIFSKELVDSPILYLTLAQGGHKGLWHFIYRGLPNELSKSESFLVLMAQYCYNSESRGAVFPKLMSYIDKELFKQPDFVNMLVKHAPGAIMYVDKSLMTNPKFVAKHILDNSQLITDEYLLNAFDYKTLNEAADLLASRSELSEELSEKVDLAIETLKNIERERQRKEASKRRNPVASTISIDDEPRSPDRPRVHVAMKTPDGRTVIKTR